MTVLSAVQLAAPSIGITVPTALYTATDRTSVELQALTNEAAQGVCDDFDWQLLKRLNTITGDGSDEAFSLPSDYARMPKKTRLWPSATPNSPLTQIESEDDWLGLEVQNFDAVTGRWIIYGGELHIKPAIALAATVKHFYIWNKIVIASGGSAPTKTEFTLDSDVFFLGDRILKLAVIWRWKASKGRPYAEDLQNYNAVRDSLAAGDKGSKILRLGTKRTPSGVSVAYPGELGP